MTAIKETASKPHALWTKSACGQKKTRSNPKKASIFPNLVAANEKS
ncbi:hypothetical protein [Oricola indica]